MEILELLRISIKWVFDRKSRMRLWGYRPEVVCLVKSTSENKVLVVRPQAHRAIWVPPQEGIGEGETIEKAAQRCLEVELGLKENQIQYRKSVWVGKIKFQPDRWNERELTYSLRGLFGGATMIGKAYFGALIIADEDASIKSNLAETAAWEWVDRAEFIRRISKVPQEKQFILLKTWELIFEQKLD